MGQRNGESNTEHRHHRTMTYLCSINDVDFALDCIGYVSSSQPAFLVHSRCGSSGIIQVAGHHAGTFDVHLPVHFICFNKIAFDIFQPSLIGIDVRIFIEMGTLTSYACPAVSYQYYPYHPPQAKKTQCTNLSQSCPRPA